MSSENNLKKDLRDLLVKAYDLIVLNGVQCADGRSTDESERAFTTRRNFAFIEDYIDFSELSRNGEKSIRRLLLAFSGGPDSTALLLALNELAEQSTFEVFACHINHGLRGQESEADAQFCQEFCRQRDIKYQEIKLELSGNRFSEDTLRQKRYQSLASFAREKEIHFILTAHTLDDQVETMLFRLFRGTGLAGLRGVDSCRKLENALYLVRPLLNVSKLQCDQFLQSHGITARLDSSNLDAAYTRNYIRHEVLPVITRRFPDLFQRLDVLRQIIQGENELLEKLGRTCLDELDHVNPNRWMVEDLIKQPLALQRRAVAHALQKREIEVSYVRVEEILNLKEGMALNLDENWRIKRLGKELFWEEIIGVNEDNISSHFDPVEVKIPGISPVLSIDLALSVEPYKGNLAYSEQFLPVFPIANSSQALVDLSRIKPPLVIRVRQPGDIIRPLGMPNLVKLKKFLHTHKMAKSASSFAYPAILLADQEEVLWLPGIGLSEKIKVTGSPSHRLSWLKLKDCDLVVS